MIAERVAGIRGMEFTGPVGADVRTAEQFETFVREEIEKEYGTDKFQGQAAAFRLLGLIPKDLDLKEAFIALLKDQVGGWYDPATKAFYMVDRFNQGMMADIIMAHELTHALDDQHFDLAGLFEEYGGGKNGDAEFAMRSVAEGSGMQLMNIYSRDYVPGDIASGVLAPPDGEELMKIMEEQGQALDGMPPFLVMTLALPYIVGNTFLANDTNFSSAALTDISKEVIIQAFSNLPISSEQVIHPEKYWDAEQIDLPREVAMTRWIEGAPEDWKLLDTDTLGELGCFVLTAEELPSLADQAALMTAQWTNEAATGWGGDRYALFGAGEEARLLVWHSVWDSEKDRVEFQEAFLAIQGDFPVAHVGEGDSFTVYLANKAGRAAYALLAEVPPSAPKSDCCK